MGIDQVAVLEQFRALAATVEGVVVAYAPTQASEGEGGVPGAPRDFPCAIVLPGQSSEYILHPGQHRHTYEVRVLLLMEGVDDAQNAWLIAPMPDRVIEVFVGNVTLGGRANSVLFERSTGLATVEWAGISYLGYEFTFRVSEQASANPAAGS